MFLSDISIKRPVFATVLTLLLVVFGLITFKKLPLREYPDIDPPVVSIDTVYPGASASIVETRITKIIEDRISGIEGIKFIESSSTDGRSRINIEFDINRDIDGAANDIRDRVSGVLDNLPAEADPPDIQKADSSDDVILWLNLVSTEMNTLELTDYAKRYLEDKFSVLPGVARVRIGGGLEYSMRVWLDREKMAARSLTVPDIENALRRENIELPAGSIESKNIQFTARIKRLYKTPEDFANLAIIKDGDYIIKLGDIARVEKEAVEKRTFFKGNGIPMIGIGIIKQSKANTVTVAKEAVELGKRLAPNLPKGMEIINSYDTSVFISSSIQEVYKTLFIAVFIVALIIYLFLGSFKAMIIPFVTIPVSLISTFIILYLFDYSINILTLLGLVLAIGLVVDDAIVVLENISRRIDKGESRLYASYYGTRQVGFAVIATTVVLIAVFFPITLLEGNIGRLFTEFAVTMTAAVCFSTFIAITLCSMLASKLLDSSHNKFSISINNVFFKFNKIYKKILIKALRFKFLSIFIFLIVAICSGYLLNNIKSEYAPKEDRGAFFILVTGPEGASYSYTKEYLDEIEKRLMPYVENGEFIRLLVRGPRSFGNLASFNDGIVIIVLNDWNKRRSAFTIMQEINKKLSDLPGVRAFSIMRQAFGGRVAKPVQFVIGGANYDELVEVREKIFADIREINPGFIDLDSDYKETKPQLEININKKRAADLGVSVQDIGSTLETMLGSRKVTTFIDDGEEYDVIIEGQRDSHSTPVDIKNIYVRSNKTNSLIPLSNLVDIDEYADASKLNRYNKIRSITLEAGLNDNLSLGGALEHLENLVKKYNSNIIIDYKGQSYDYVKSTASLTFIFSLCLLIVFLVLAAQFESFVHPIVIILTVPFGVAGALLGLYITGNTINVYTQIGLIVLIGLSAKNGILIVEFINQLRSKGSKFHDAILSACELRLRPIIMTSITTSAGSIPLIVTFGAGSETRMAIGTVILFGVMISTFFTLIIVPVAYDLLAKKTKTKDYVSEKLSKEESSINDN